MGKSIYSQTRWPEFNPWNLPDRKSKIYFQKLSSDLHMYAIAYTCPYINMNKHVYTHNKGLKKNAVIASFRELGIPFILGYLYAIPTFYLCVWVFCLNVHLCTSHILCTSQMSEALEGQKRASDSLLLELKVILSQHVGTRNHTFWNSSKCF